VVFAVLFDNLYKFWDGRTYWHPFGNLAITLMGGILGGVGFFVVATLLLTDPQKSKSTLSVTLGVLFAGIGMVAFGSIFGQSTGTSNSAGIIYTRPVVWMTVGTLVGASLGATLGLSAGKLLIAYSNNPLSFYSRKMLAPQYRGEFWTIANKAIMSIVFAAAIGRIGCFLAGCCFGASVGDGLGWLGADFNYGNSVGTVYATNIIEAVFLFTLGAAMMATRLKYRHQILVFGYGYSIFRFLIEFLRADARGAMILGLSPSQWQSIVFLGITIALHLYINKTGRGPLDDNLEPDQQETDVLTLATA
jgi:prolipoprotein diacylglyceryltransferase